MANGDVTVEVRAKEELAYEETDLSFFCPNTDSHHTDDGSFISDILMEGFTDEENKTVITEDPDGAQHEKIEYIHGAATNISIE